MSSIIPTDVKLKIIKDNELQLWYALLGERIAKSKFLSPLRQERHPSAFLWKPEDRGRVLFVDMGSTVTHMTIEKYVQFAYGLDFEEAIDFLYKLHKNEEKVEGNIIINLKTKMAKNIMKREIKYKKLDKLTDIAKEYLSFYGIDHDKHMQLYKQGLANFSFSQIEWYQIDNIRIITNVADGVATRKVPFAFVYEYYDKSVKIYSPYSKMKWVGTAGKSTVGTIKNEEAQVNIITSSAKDAMSMYQNSVIKMNVFHFSSETTLPSKSALDQLIEVFRQIPTIIIYDNDNAGREAARKLKSYLKQLYGFSAELAFSDYKDPSDEYNNNKHLKSLDEKIKMICTRQTN